MAIIYTGRDLKKLLNEKSYGYKPIINGRNKVKPNNTKQATGNLDTEIQKNKFKPVVDRDLQSSDIGNNKNMLDLQFDNKPSKKYTDRVKKAVTGEDSELGNKIENNNDSTSNTAFYKAAKNASKNFTKNRKDLENSGIVGKTIPVNQKETPFSEQKLYFKNTKFINEEHVFSLIPQDYKINENKFVMKDKYETEYLIEWRIDPETKISEPKILKCENIKRTQEELSKIKSLYGYNSKKQSGSLTNKQRVNEDSNFSKNIEKIRKISE